MTRYILDDYDSPIVDARDGVIKAAFHAMVELVSLVEDAKRRGSKNPRTEDLINKVDVLLRVEEG